MTELKASVSKRLLTPNERIAEVLFGLIMVLTFTGSLSAATAGRGDVRTMLIGALGCNLAWGIIDGLFYLMGCIAEQGNGIRAWHAFKEAPTPEEAHQVIGKLLPPAMAGFLTPDEYEAVRLRLVKLPEPPRRPRLDAGEWLAALMVFLWVFAITFPVAIPFFVMKDVPRAMRVSNGIAIVLLFIAGYAFGRCAEFSPWLTGFVMVLVGLCLVGMTIALGG